MSRCVYVGNFSVDFTTETHVAWALETLGVQVTRLQENVVRAQEIEAACCAADWMLYTRTPGFSPSPAREWLAMLQRLPIPSVSYHLDLYAGLRRGAGLKSDPFWRTKHVFSADGGSEAFFRRHGINHTWIRPGVHEPECYITTPDPGWACDVLFVGNGGPRQGYHPEWPYRTDLIRFLSKRYGHRFSKHGHVPMGLVGRGHVRGHDLNVAYASAKVVVGDTLCLGPEDRRNPRFRHARYSSDRLFETPGRGGVLVYPRIEGMTDELIDWEDIVYYDYGDFAGLGRIIDELLANDARREAIRTSGAAKVKSGCTYTHRMAEMLGILAEREPSLAWTGGTRVTEREREHAWWDDHAKPGSDIQPLVGTPAAIEARLGVVLPIMKKALGRKKGAILDLGCGPGRIAIPIAAALPKALVVGVDISTEMLNLASEAAGKAGVNLDLVKADGRDLPDSVPTKLHGAYSVVTFQHMPLDAVTGYIQQTAERLVPGGVFVFQFVTGTGSEFLAHRFQEDDIVAAVKGCGLVVDDVLRGVVHPEWAWVVARKP